MTRPERLAFPAGALARAVLLLLALLQPARALCSEPPVLDGPEIARLETQDRACAITFDDGPGKDTPRLLDVLRSRGVRATFFVLGERVIQHPALIRRMAAEGHEIDNHSYDHPALRGLPEGRQKREIEKTERALAALGVTPRYFRPPYGLYDAQTVRLAGEEGMVLALWSVDSEDWKYRSVKDIEGRVLPRKSRPAEGVFLFHDIHATTVAAMPEVLDRLAAEGCRFVTLGQWAAERAGGAQADSPAAAR